MTTQYTENIIPVSADREMYVTEIGQGDPVVLLHGGGPGASGRSNFSRNIDALAERFRVIIPDLPGYGRSTKGVDGEDPFGFLADQTRAMLDHLGIERAHLVGNSYGGACALRLSLDTPNRVNRLVLMGPGGIGVTRGLPTAGLTHLLNYYGGDGPSREKLTEFIREDLVYDGSAITDDIIEERYQSSIDPDVVAAPPLRRPKGPAAPRVLWRMDFTRDKRLRELQTPTLVLWGAEDKVNRPAGGLTLAQTLPNCELICLSRTGHWVQWEQAERFNDIVQRFLSAETALTAELS